jgi:hypothetical protein
VNEKARDDRCVLHTLATRRTLTMSNRMPQSYRDEDISGSLLGISIAFIILETTVMALMYALRYYARGERANLWMETFMTITYVVCQGKITVAICKAVRMVVDKAALMVLCSDRQDWWRRTPSRHVTTENHTECDEVVGSTTDCVSVDDVAC